MISLAPSGSLRLSPRVIVPRGLGRRLEWGFRKGTPETDLPEIHYCFSVKEPSSHFAVRISISRHLLGNLAIDLTEAALETQERFAEVISYFGSPPCSRLVADSRIYFGNDYSSVNSRFQIVINGHNYNARFERTRLGWTHSLFMEDTLLGQISGAVQYTSGDARSVWCQFEEAALGMPSIIRRD